MFNEGRYLDRLKKGELVARVLADAPAPKKAGQPPGTRSQMLAYQLPSGKLVAKVHQYLRPDGTIGASGKPDPKVLIEDGIFHAVIKPS